MTWTFELHDATPMGFLAFALYLLAGAFCFGNAVLLRDHLRRASMWLLTALFLWGMGVNKQLDLHNLISDFGRIIATDQGWYDSRRAVQRTVIIVLIVAGLLIALFLIGLYWRLVIEHQVLLLGLIILVGVIVFQASSFHHFNPLGFLVEYAFFDVIELIALLLMSLDSGVFLREIWRGGGYDDGAYAAPHNPAYAYGGPGGYDDADDDIESTRIMPSPYAE